MRNLLIILAFVLAACVGNGDGVNVSPEPVQHAPQISNLTLSPDNALYMEGDGSVQVTAEFSFADVGQDIETLHIGMSDGTSLTVAIADVANTAAGTLAEAFAVTTADAGVQTVEIWLVDKAGQSSNHLSAPFSVTEHAPEISSVNLSPDSALYMEGDGSIQVTAEFSFTDLGRDIETLHIEMSDGTSLMIELADSINTVSGTLAEAFDVTTANADGCTVEIWLVDKTGQSSNHLSAPFSVTEHAPEISSVNLSPDSALYMEGNASVTVSAQITFGDAGLDIQTLWIQMPDGTSISFAETQATESGTYNEVFVMSTEEIGAFGVVFWLVDKAGSASVHHIAEFTVTADVQGSDWTNRMSGLPHALSEVIWDGDAFIAVGDGGTVLTSADGIAWLGIESGTGADLNDVAFYGSDIFAVGDEIILHSTDHGTSWTVKDRPTEAAFEGVAINASQVVIGGQHMEWNTAIVLISEDRGDTWRAVDSWPDEGLHMNDLVYQDGLFVAPTPYYGEAWVTVSSDGKVWNEVAVGDEWGWTSDTIIHDGSQFILPGTDGAVFTSFDGFNWTRLQTPVRDVSYSSAAWSGSKLVIAGTSMFWCWWFWPCDEPFDVPAGISSIDGGMTWELFDIDDSYESLGLAWGNGRFVSVGQKPQFDGEGAIYTTD